MRNYINFRVIENAETPEDAIDNICDGNISESHYLSDKVIELTPELEKIITEYCKSQQP